MILIFIRKGVKDSIEDDEAPTERLQTRSYDTMKERHIKALLKEYNLSIDGSSEARIARHKQ